MKRLIQRKQLTRLLSALLILALGFPPSSAFALRPVNAGLEQSPVRRELKQKLSPTTGLEEEGKKTAGGYLDALVKAMDELLEARKEEEVAAAVEGFVQEALGYGGVALYLVEPPARWDEPFRIHSHFRNGFKGSSSVETLGPAVHEKEWALRAPSSDGDLEIDRWESLRGSNAGWVDGEALQRDAKLYGGKENVRWAYYYTVKNLGVPSLLVLIQNWESGRPLFRGGTDLERAESRRRVRETLTTLGRAFLLAMENVRSYRRSEERAKMAGPLHALRNALSGVTSRSELLELDLDPQQHRDISQLNREIQSLSFALARDASDILQGLRNSPQESVGRSQAPPLSLDGKDLAPFAQQIHDLAGELMEPVRRGDVETLQERIAKTETEILAQIQLAKREGLDGLDPVRQPKVRPVRTALSVLDRWMTLGSSAIAARQELRGETEKWIPQLRLLMAQTGTLAKLGEKLQAAGEQMPPDGGAQEEMRRVAERVSRLPQEVERFVQEFGDTLGVEPERLTAAGPRDLVVELRSAVESSVAWQDGHVRYQGPVLPQGGIARWPADPQRAVLAADTLSELLHNAWKYRRGKKLQVEVVVHFDSGTNMLKVTVKDNGKGIPIAQQSHLFEMGNRLDRDEIRAVEGTGFGLATLQMELEKKGGGLELVQSRAVPDVKRARETGSTFRFWIPIQDPPEVPSSDSEKETVPVSTGLEENPEPTVVSPSHLPAGEKPSGVRVVTPDGSLPNALTIAIRKPAAGLEEVDELHLREAVQGLYQFPDLVEEHFGKDGSQPASWKAFLKAAEQESSWAWNGLGSFWKAPQKVRQWLAVRSLRTLPVPLRFSVGGELVVHNNREGVLLLGENGAEPSLLAIFMTGDSMRGYRRHNPWEWITTAQKNEHTWTYLGGNGDLLVLEFPQGLYAGRLPSKTGQRQPLTTRFPLVGAAEVPVHEGPFEGRAFRTEIEGKDQFVPLKGVVRFSRNELLDVRAGSLPLDTKLPESLRKLPAEDLAVDLSPLRWRNNWRQDPKREEAIRNLQSAVRTVEDFFIPQLSAGLEESDGWSQEIEKVLDAYVAHPEQGAALFRFQGHGSGDAVQVLDFFDRVIEGLARRGMPRNQMKLLALTEQGPPFYVLNAPVVTEILESDLYATLRAYYVGGGVDPLPLEQAVPNAALREEFKSVYDQLSPQWQAWGERERTKDPNSRPFLSALSRGLADRNIPQEWELTTPSSWLLGRFMDSEINTALRETHEKGDEQTALQHLQAHQDLVEWVSRERNYSIARQEEALLRDPRYRGYLIVGTFGADHQNIASMVPFGSVPHAASIPYSGSDYPEPVSELRRIRASRQGEPFSQEESRRAQRIMPFMQILSLLEDFQPRELRERTFSQPMVVAVRRMLDQLSDAQLHQLNQAIFGYVHRMAWPNGAVLPLNVLPASRRYLMYAWLNSNGLVPGEVKAFLPPDVREMTEETVWDTYLATHGTSAGMEEGVRVGSLWVPPGGLKLDGLTVQATGEIATGLEQVLEPGQPAIAVPVRDQPMVRMLFHGPAIRELQASVYRAGVQVRNLTDPATAHRMLAEAEEGALILLAPDEDPAEWVPASGRGRIPIMVIPPAVAAGMEERQWAALAAAARAHDGFLRVSDVTQTGLEEGILVLRTAA